MGIQSKISNKRTHFEDGPPPAVADAELTPAEQRFVYNVEVLGMTQQRAAEMAGVAPHIAQRPNVIEAREIIRTTAAARTNITKEVVIEGLKEAIDLAKLQGDAMPMIAGWREIAKLLGYDQAIKLEIVRSETVDGLRKQLQQLPEAKLIELAGGGDLGGIIDGDFYELNP